jgi:hypothetical protein
MIDLGLIEKKDNVVSRSNDATQLDGNDRNKTSEDTTPM